MMITFLYINEPERKGCLIMSNALTCEMKLDKSLMENLKALELLQGFSDVADCVSLIHHVLAIHDLLSDEVFDRIAAEQLIVRVYEDNMEFYRDIRDVPGIISLPFCDAPRGILIYNLTIQLAYLKGRLENIVNAASTDLLTRRTGTLVLRFIYSN